MGFRIFALCLRQLYVNWLVAVRLSWFWLLIVIVAILAVAGFIGPVLGMGSEDGDARAGLLILLAVLAIFIIGLVAFTTIAIGWHRWVLMDEEPDRFYVLHGGWPILSYILRSLLIVLLTLLVMIPALLLVSMVLGQNMSFAIMGQNLPQNASLAYVLAYLALSTLATWIILRIGPILPALAVGERLSIRESFRLTRPIAGALSVTAFCLVVFQLIPYGIDFLVTAVAGSPASALGLVLVAFGLVFAWVSFFVSFGIFTVVYGHVVEGRPL